MDKQYVSVASIRTYLTSDGCIALESDEIDPALELDVFGPKGISPPRKLANLTADMLNVMSAAPDHMDAADLRAVAAALRDSLAQVETTLARLESGMT